MAENILTVIGADASVQQQYLDTTRRSEHLEPEKALLAALLSDAIHTYRKFRTARSRVGRECFREVEEWIMAGRDEWIFSFNNVCDLLDLDPDYVRRGVLEPKEQTVSKERPRQRHGIRKVAA
jgi:hypothetical protein